MLQKHKHLLLQMFYDTQTFSGEKKDYSYRYAYFAVRKMLSI